MKLSNNFSLEEMTRSTTAARKGIKNDPDDDQVGNLIILCEEVLQPLRDALGPINISSGFRSVELNSAIGGSSSSQHCALKGAASDIDMGKRNAEVFNYIKENLEWDQLIWEFGDNSNPSWVHVSYNNGNNRKQILKAIKQNGRTKYINFW